MKNFEEVQRASGRYLSSWNCGVNYINRYACISVFKLHNFLNHWQIDGTPWIFYKKISKPWIDFVDKSTYILIKFVSKGDVTQEQELGGVGLFPFFKKHVFILYSFWGSVKNYTNVVKFDLWRTIRLSHFEIKVLMNVYAIKHWSFYIK